MTPPLEFSAPATAPARCESLGQLQAQHTELLRDYHASGSTPEITARIQVFITAGCQLGEVLCEDEERESAQQILDHWATLLYRIASDAPDASLREFNPDKQPSLRDEDCPYLGLAAFDEEQHNCFFGRERLIEHCAELLANSPILAVIGQSGSGKSSLICGGLISALKTNQFPELRDSQFWTYFGPIVPGSEPDENLLSVLLRRNQARNFEQILRHVREDPTRLQGLFREKGGMVLAIDQFEEIFTLCESEEARALFLRLLVAFTETQGTYRRVIITMRSEFETWVARDPDFHRLFAAGQIRMVPMDQAELQQAIEGPAAKVGLKFESGLVEAMIHDTLGEPAALPMLQFTLLKLWEKRERNRIPMAAYQELGGTRMALAKCANEFYVRLTRENQDTARRILLRMVRIGEGFEVHSQRVRLASLYESGEDRNRIDFVVAELVRAHLVRVTGGDTPVAQIEVAHEALIRNWPTLFEWIQRTRTDLLTRRRLNEYVAEWLRRGKTEAGLFDAELLAEAERWMNSDAAREFGSHDLLPTLVAASREQQQRLEEERTAQAQAERERADAEKTRLQRQKEAEQRLRLRLAVALFLGSILVLAGVAYYSMQTRRLQGELSQKQEEVERKRSEVEALQKQAAEEQRKQQEHLAEEAQRQDQDRQSIDQAKSAVDVSRKDAEAKQIALDRQKAELEQQIKANELLRRADLLVAQAEKPALTPSTSAAPVAESKRDRFPSPGAKLLVFYSGEAQKEVGNAASTELTSSDYPIVKFSNMEKTNAYIPPATEVRYFRRQDKAEAEHLAKLLQPFDAKATISWSPDARFGNSSAPYFEIWLSKLAALGAAASAAP